MKESPHPVKEQKFSNCNKKSKDPKKSAQLQRSCRSSGGHHPTTRSHEFPGTACPGGQLKATFASSQSFKKRETLSPCHPMTCIVPLHTLSSWESLDETLFFRPRFTFTFTHWTLWATESPRIPKFWSSTTTLTTFSVLLDVGHRKSNCDNFSYFKCQVTGHPKMSPHPH